MPHEKVKVYFDGSHYIGIPQNEGRSPGKGGYHGNENDEMRTAFEKAYKGAKAKRRKEKVTKIVAELKPQFKNEEQATEYVKAEMERIQRNLIVRRTRLARKINLGTWNYFCTFTYDDQKHTEDSFRTKLRDCFKKMCHRKGWIYIGVWERSPNSNRLHFHGLFNIPENAMVGELMEHRDYSTKTHRMQTTLQNSYFTERFGRNDFESINKQELPNATAYLMKYIEKSGERIVYSKNTPAYFVSDILDDDVVCTIGQEDRKLLLFDNFICFDDGVFIGEVCPEVIEKMPKKN